MREYWNHRGAWRSFAYVLFAGGASLLLSACPPGTDGAMDPDLVGEWLGTAGFVDVEVGDATLLMDDWRWELETHADGNIIGGTYSANTTTDPRQINLIYEYNVEDGEVVLRDVPDLWLGIYEVSDSMLTLVHNSILDERPDDFEGAIFMFEGELAR